MMGTLSLEAVAFPSAVYKRKDSNKLKYTELRF